MKKIFLFLAIALCATAAKAQDDHIEAATLNMQPGEEAKACISLINPNKDYTNFLLDVVLPEGLSFCEYKSGRDYVWGEISADRKADHTLSSSQPGDDPQRRRFLGASATNKNFYNDDEEGNPVSELMYFGIKADENLAGGKYTVVVEKVTFAEVVDGKGVDQEMEDITFIVNIPEMDPTKYLDPASGSIVENLYSFTLTCNDLTVNEGASVVLYNIDREEIATATVEATDGGATITLDKVVSEAGEYILSIAEGSFNISDNASVAGNARYTIKVSDAAEIVFTPADNATVEELSEIKVYCEEGINATWNAGDAEVKNADGETVATVADIQFPEDWDDIFNLTLILSNAVTEEGIYTVEIPTKFFTMGKDGLSFSEAITLTYTVGKGTGIMNVVNGEANRLDIYTIQGQKVRGSHNELPAGLYIVNGQKMIKK